MGTETDIIDAELVPYEPAALEHTRSVADIAELDDVRETVADIIANAKAPNTRAAYEHDARLFIEWCDRYSLPSLPALDHLGDTHEVRTALQRHSETVLTFLGHEHQRGMKAATIERRAAGIGEYHRQHGWPTPTTSDSIRRFIAGLRNMAGDQRKVEALTVDRLTAMIDATPDDTARGRRDRAVILVGLHGAFRRSELAALQVGDYQPQTDDRATILLRRSKTDETGRGQYKSINRFATLCPRAALDDWLADLEQPATDSPMFRQIDRHGNIRTTGITGRTVAEIVKAAAERGGVDPATVSGHSMRAGFVTIAAGNGATTLEIQQQTGHKSAETVAGYVRSETIHNGNAATRLIGGPVAHLATE